MSLAESRGALTKGLREFLNRWMEAKAVWQDSQAENFERQYVLMIENEVRKATASMDHVNIALMQIVKNCE